MTNAFLLAGTLAQPLEGPPIEELLLLRDEQANVGMGHRTTPHQPAGAGHRRGERRHRLRRRRARRHNLRRRCRGTGWPAPCRRIGSRCCRFVPTPTAPRSASPAPPRSTSRAGAARSRAVAVLLGDPDEPLLIPEEEVPREGAVVRRSFQAARGRRWPPPRLAHPPQDGRTRRRLQWPALRHAGAGCGRLTGRSHRMSAPGGHFACTECPERPSLSRRRQLPHPDLRGELSMADRLTPIETVMWRAGQDPTLRMTIGTVVLLDRSPGRDVLSARLETAVTQAPRLAAHPERMGPGPARTVWVDDDDSSVDDHLRAHGAGRTGIDTTTARPDRVARIGAVRPRALAMGRHADRGTRRRAGCVVPARPSRPDRRRRWHPAHRPDPRRAGVASRHAVGRSPHRGRAPPRPPSASGGRARSRSRSTCRGACAACWAASTPHATSTCSTLPCAARSGRSTSPTPSPARCCRPASRSPTDPRSGRCSATTR